METSWDSSLTGASRRGVEDWRFSVSAGSEAVESMGESVDESVGESAVTERSGEVSDSAWRVTEEGAESRSESGAAAGCASEAGTAECEAEKRVTSRTETANAVAVIFAREKRCGGRRWC